MRHSAGHAAKEYRCIVRYTLLTLPAVGLGILAMIRSGVSPALWGQQAAAFAVFALLAQPLRHVLRRVPISTKSALLLLLLVATLLFEEIEGVRRWVDLGVFNVHAAMLVLPALLVMLCSMKRPYPVFLGAATVLCLQPDLSQLTAFSMALLPLLWNHRKDKTRTLLSVLTLAALIIGCAFVPAVLHPVEYCEGILTMLGDVSWLLRATGVVALAAIPAFGVIQFIRHRQMQMLCFSIYYAVSILFSLSGNYPVPFIGFGLSPIAGYHLAYVCDASVTDKEPAA